MDNLVKIKGKEGLAKDPQTNAIVNTNVDAFKAARAAKKRLLQSIKKEEELEIRVERLEKILLELTEK